jgi:hypothetical protein
MSAKERQITGTFNSLVFHTNSAVDFGFNGISYTISALSMAILVAVRAGEDWVQTFILILFNAPFSSCFTKSAKMAVIEELIDTYYTAAISAPNNLYYQILIALWNGSGCLSKYPAVNDLYFRQETSFFPLTL